MQVKPNQVPTDLPGAELVAAGVEALTDVACGKRRDFSIEALLVAVGASRLRAAGLDVPQPPGLPDQPELALHAALCATGDGNSHSRYNALIRRLVSFEHALERQGRNGDEALAQDARPSRQAFINSS